MCLHRVITKCRLCSNMKVPPALSVVHNNLKTYPTYSGRYVLFICLSFGSLNTLIDWLLHLQIFNTLIDCLLLSKNLEHIKQLVATVSPHKHRNSLTIFKMSTSAQLGCKRKVLRGCVSASQAEVDKFNIVTEFPCLLGHTVSFTNLENIDRLVAIIYKS